MVERLQALPDAQSAATATSLPAGWSWDSTLYRGENQPPTAPGELRVALSQSISPDFFRAAGVPLVGGRFFISGDGPESPPVAIVSQNLAHRIWGNQEAVGKLGFCPCLAKTRKRRGFHDSGFLAWFALNTEKYASRLLDSRGIQKNPKAGTG